MPRRVLSVTLITLIVNLAVAVPVTGATKGEKEARFAEKVKAGVTKLGTGPEARVEVRLRNNTKAKGYVSEARENDFVVVDEKTGQTVQTPYSEVKEIKGHNSATGAKVALSAGGGLGTGIIFGAATIGGVLLVVSLLLRGS